MQPAYLLENSYSYLIRLQPILGSSDYEVDNPELSFERSVQQQFAQANEYLYQEEYRLALDAYNKLRGLILSVADPQLPPQNRGFIDWTHLVDATMIDPLMSVAVNMLQHTPIVSNAIPANLVESRLLLPAAIQQRIQPYETVGLQEPTLARVSVLLN